MGKLLVLIPNYRGGAFICDTIKPIKEGIPESFVLVVDDASPDNPKSYLEGLSDHNIYRTANGGYAPAVNTGLQYFIENDEFQYVMITNSDIKVDVPKVKSIYSSILKNLKDSHGVLGFLEGSRDSNFYQGVNMSGFLFVLSRKVVEEVGMLDEEFYMYGEEQDYFLRVEQAGYSLIQSKIVVGHEAEGSGTSSIRNSWFAIRNSILIEFKLKKINKILRKIAALFFLINKLYKPKNSLDPSYLRVTRQGILIGNILLIGAILWNMLNLIKKKND